MGLKHLQMTISQLQSLNDNELRILWFIINKVNPSVMEDFELDPHLFVAINHKRLMDRVLQCRKYIKEEFESIFDTLVMKLKNLKSVKEDETEYCI